jgi:ElaB/YqjD/DUF883 family membrane-anchored ribosome-binding protein
MSTTPDMAPNRAASTGSGRSTPARRTAAARTPASRTTAARRRAAEPDLEAQVQQLQADLKGIAASLASLAEQKVGEAQSVAKRELRNLKAQGEQAVEDAQDEFGAIEKQLKDTIREKPLTAVAGAVALGFILAVVSR